jgi:hypothetical protein
MGGHLDQSSEERITDERHHPPTNVPTPALPSPSETGEKWTDIWRPAIALFGLAVFGLAFWVSVRANPDTEISKSFPFLWARLCRLYRRYLVTTSVRLLACMTRTIPLRMPCGPLRSSLRGANILNANLKGRISICGRSEVPKNQRRPEGGCM